MTRDEYVEFLKSSALDLGKRAVMNRLIAQVPFLSNGFFGGIVGIFVGQVLKILIKETEFGAFFLYIDIRTNHQGQAFEIAAKDWYFASPEEKSKYEAAYLDSFYRFASLKS